MPEFGLVEALLLVPFLAVFVWALVDVIRRPESQMRYLPKWGWVLVVLLGNTLGQIVYLAVGREKIVPGSAELQQAAPTSGANAVDTLYGRPGDDRR